MRAVVQIGSVAVHHGPLQEKRDQTPSLLAIQLQRSTWGEAHPQPLLSTPASCITPAHHRTCIAADAPPHLIERVTRIQQRQSSPASIFEQVGAPFQSGHRCPPPEHLLLHYLCRSL